MTTSGSQSAQLPPVDSQVIPKSALSSPAAILDNDSCRVEVPIYIFQAGTPAHDGAHTEDEDEDDTDVRLVDDLGFDDLVPNGIGAERSRQTDRHDSAPV